MCPRIPIRAHKGASDAAEAPITAPTAAAYVEGGVPGTLYVVPTPIGNWEDISLRALRILSQVDLIIAEDPRLTKQLLRHYQIATRVQAYSAYPEPGDFLLELLSPHFTVALVCDGGTPTIEDPGGVVISAALNAGYRVSALPGPMAAIVALSAAGFPTHRFAFDGFPPRSPVDRLAFFTALVHERRTIILYESTAFLRSTLESLYHCLGPERSIVIASDLTTPGETLWRGNLNAALQFTRHRIPRGAFTIVVSGTD